MNRDDRPPRHRGPASPGGKVRTEPRPRSARLAWEQKRAARRPKAATAAPEEIAPPTPPLRLGVVYGEPFAPLLAPAIGDLVRAAMAIGHNLEPIPAERALAEKERCAAVERLYVLPFDPPRGSEATPRDFIREAFPHAEILNSMEAHELCWDKVRSEEQLLGRSVPVPESLLTQSADDVREFVAKHEFVVLKERRSCGGQGHVVLVDGGDVLVGESGGHRFVVELGDDPQQRRRLRDGVLSYPPPFFVQRIVGDPGARGVFRPGQVLRAYVAEGRIAFWTERYRDHYKRPSDWIVNVALGARYRFVQETSAELRKLALRAADALGVRVGAIDIIRSAAGAFVLEADTDGRHMYIDRSFKQIPEYRGAFDFDRLVVAALSKTEIPALAAPL